MMRTIKCRTKGDLILGSKDSQIAKLVERKTRYVLLAKVNRKDSKIVVDALIKQAHKLPRSYINH